jgi:CxxC motif-containing protein
MRLFFDGEGSAPLWAEGAECAKGREYAERELTDPRRTLTSTVKVRGGCFPLVSARSSAPLPKHMLLPAAALLRGVSLQAPVAAGQVILPDIMGTGTALVATGTVERALGL